MIRFRTASLPATSSLAFAFLGGTILAWSNDVAASAAPQFCSGDYVCDDDGSWAIAAVSLDERTTRASVQAITRLMRNGAVVVTTPAPGDLQALAFKQRGGPSR